MLWPAVLLAVVGTGLCVIACEKLNVPAARASHTFTRMSRASTPVFIVWRELVFVRLTSSG